MLWEKHDPKIPPSSLQPIPLLEFFMTSSTFLTINFWWSHSKSLLFVCFIGGQIPTSRLEQKSPNFYFVHHMSTTNFEIWIWFFSTRWNFSIEIKINKKSQSNHLFHSKKPICNSLKISKEEFHEKIVIQAFLDLRC